MSENTSSVPKWITIYLWITVVMTLMFSLLAYFKPDIQFGTWEAFGASGALSLAGPLGLYIARNLATFVVGLYSLTKKSTGLITMYVILRLVEDGMDSVHNLMAGNMQSAIFAIVMFAIEIIAFMQLRKS